jgi:predicted RNA-binding protein with PIN domain
VSTKRDHLLVDGYNLIKSGQLFQRRNESLEQARLSLQQVLDAYSRRTATKVTLYYDGDGALKRAANSRHGQVEIEFSRSPEKADDLIMRAVQDRHGAKWLRVITSDREIRRFAARHKIRSTSSEDFLDELEAPPAKPAPPPADPKAAARRLDPSQLDEWEKLFTAQRATAPKRRPQRRNDGTESDPDLDELEVDEWEKLFKRGKRNSEEP